MRKCKQTKFSMYPLHSKKRFFSITYHQGMRQCVYLYETMRSTL